MAQYVRVLCKTPRFRGWMERNVPIVGRCTGGVLILRSMVLSLYLGLEGEGFREGTDYQIRGGE